jgi:predicted phosphodiesterase
VRHQHVEGAQVTQLTRRSFLRAAADAYGVDLVLCGHDHDYERTYTVHGTDPGTAMRPTVVSTSLTNSTRAAVPVGRPRSA